MASRVLVIRAWSVEDKDKDKDKDKATRWLESFLQWNQTKTSRQRVNIQHSTSTSSLAFN